MNIKDASPYKIHIIFHVIRVNYFVRRNSVQHPIFTGLQLCINSRLYEKERLMVTF